MRIDLEPTPNIDTNEDTRTMSELIAELRAETESTREELASLRKIYSSYDEACRLFPYQIKI